MKVDNKKMKDYLRKFDKFVVSINPPKENQDVNILKEYQEKLKDLAYFTTSIIHDKDLDNQGQPKTIHLHIYLEYREKYTRKQVLTQIIDILECHKDQISIEFTNSSILYIQYLTHLNDQDKYQYNYNDIISNNYPLLDIRYNDKYQKPLTETEYILQEMEKSISIKDLATRIGLEKASRYRALFNQLREERGIFKDDIINTLGSFNRNMVKMLEVLQHLEKLYLSNVPFLPEQLDKEILHTIIEVTALAKDIIARSDPYNNVDIN